LNIGGLTLGLTAVILISIFVFDEKQFDSQVKDGDRIYRLYVNRVTEEANEEVAMVPPIYAASLKEKFPEVESAVRIFRIYNKTLFETGQKQVYEEGGVFADSNFMEVLPLEMAYGSANNALNEPNAVMISEELSNKLFGNNDPTNQPLYINKDTLQVKAVFKNQPHLHLRLQYILPMQELISQIEPDRMKSWRWMQFFTYVKIIPGTNLRQLEQKFKKYAHEQGTAFSVNEKYNLTPHFQKLKDIHLQSASFKHDMAIRGNGTYVTALIIIALFILLIACFNFINLATAKSMKRAREVGVRKTLGAEKYQLIFQFIGETLVLTAISMVISIALIYLLLPALNQFTDKQMSFGLFTDPLWITAILLLTLIVGVIAGFYPAIVLSSFQAIKVLKSSIVVGGGSNVTNMLRKGLVVIQFSISVFLITSALIVYLQVEYLHDKDLGFNKDQIIFFPMRGDQMYQRYQSFKTELQKQPGVSSVSIGYGFPGDATAGDQIIIPTGGEERKMPCTQLMVDHDYIKTLGLTIIAGRDFSKSIPADDAHAFIINETAVRQMGFDKPENAIGKPLYWPVWDSQQKDSLKKGNIIGVVKDFHFKSLYDKLETTVLQIYPPANWKVAVKYSRDNEKATIAGVEKVWSAFSSDQPIQFSFLDENFREMYKSEDKLRSLLWAFTGIAIFVACLGLLGLAAYSAERRKKEIGIRKVLGASVRKVVALLSAEFILLVIIAMAIATPLSWLVMSQWLKDFPYRIQISAWIFLSAGIVSILLALITVCLQTVKAAIANPVKNLRTE
jgi:putative ABC transport system permease protein